MIDIPRILQVLRPAAGGMLGHLENLLEGLNQAGYELVIACPFEERTLRCLRAAGTLHLFPLDTGDGLRIGADPYTAGRLAKFLKRQRFDLIHAHGAKAGLIARLALMKSHLATPVIVSYHNEILPPNRHFHVRIMRLHAERLLKNRTSHFIAVSPSIQQELVEKILCPPHKVSFIPNGIQLDPNNDGQVPDLNNLLLWDKAQELFVIGTALRFTWEKGIDVLLDGFTHAVKVEPQLRLVLIGDGPQEDWIKEQIDARGLQEKIRLLGYIENARRLFSLFDAFVLPSRTEGWPLTIMEAMSAGIPVIASRVGGIPTLLADGEYGILVEPGDAQGLGEACMALARNPENARAAGQKAAAYARANFDTGKMVDHVQELYATAIGVNSINTR